MTYEEVSFVLQRTAMFAGEHVHVVVGDGMDATSLMFQPTRWFIAFKPSGELSTGIFEGGPEKRLVGTKQFPFATLTVQILAHELAAAMADHVAFILDQYLSDDPPPPRR
jgi:hypothetical protein